MSKNDRSFKISDAHLLQYSKTVSLAIGRDMEKFKQFDLNFPENYPQIIHQKISEIKAIKSDNVVIDELCEKTAEVNKALEDCHDSYRTIRFFAEKAFPDNKAVQKKFGVNEANKHRSKQSAMMAFMNRLVEVTQEHRTEFLNAGCPHKVIDHLPTKKKRLEETKLQQELFKKERILNTQKRIEKLNDLYRLMRPIQNVAQIIYADDHARLNQYRMPVSKPSANRQEDDSGTND